MQAWDIETGDPDVVVAIVDTGLDVTHEDLQGGKILPGCNVAGIEFDHNNCNPDLTDFIAHGTGLTGTAAADTNNNVGVAGVCWGCSILPVKVFTDAGNVGLDDMIEGILFAVNYAQNNPTKKVIINLAIGRLCGGPTQAEQDAITLAWDNGVLIVAARGNSGDTTPFCPAAAANVIAVSGTNLDDTLWSGSSWNNVDLAAPAVPIYNIAPGALIDPPYIPTWGGTSLSSAIVSGVAGLAWSANMSMTNWQVDQLLRNTADNIGNPVFFGAGRINANAAVIQAPNPPPLPTPTPTPTPVPTPDPTRLKISSIGGVGAITGKGKAIVSVDSAEPGSVLHLVWEIQQQGGEPAVVTRGVCEGLTLDLSDPTKIARATASDFGQAVFTFTVSNKMRGNIIRVQAYTQSKGTICKKSGSPGKFIPIP